MSLANHDLAAWRATVSPQRPALWHDDHWRNYAQLNERAQRLAGFLRARGIGPGDRVGILAANSPAHFDLMLAAPKLGFIPVPFNYRLPAAELQRLFGEIEPALLICDAERAAAAQDCLAPQLELQAYEQALTAAEPWQPQQAVVGDEDVALILFTGGSTGVPKGAMISYRQQFFNAVNTVNSWGLSGSDAVIQATPAFHAAVNALATPLLHAGGRVVLPAAFEPAEYLRLMSETQVSLLFLVPTMYQMLTAQAEFETADFSAVRWAISGGAPCPDAVREPFRDRGVAFRQGYGMTEAGVNCFTIEPEDAAAHPESVGRPMPHARAVIRDSAGQAVGRGEVGELTLAGPHVFSGYFRRPEATAEALRDGWLWTGDLASVDETGLFRICGRSKEMFISGGENVYPAEIENLISAQAEVAACAVIGVADPKWGEVGVAAVSLQAGCRLEPEQLRQRLKQTLAGYQVPRHVMLLEALPCSATGKVLKPAIRQLWEQRRQESAA